MKPELTQDRSSLGWIRGELDQVLHEVRTGLEAYLEGEHDRMAQCSEQLHHVYGVLDLVQVYGGAMLAGEMERLAEAMAQGRVKRTENAAEALMLGIVQLPAYLEKIQNGAADIPVELLPVLNDLRAAHDAPLVTETSLFAPRLNAVVSAEAVQPGSGNHQLPALIHQQRGSYHRHLLNLLRGNDPEGSLRGIRDVFDALNSQAGTARLRRLLDASEALCTALLDDTEPPPAAVKSLFGQIDRVFKRVLDQGEEAAMLEFPVDLLKNMLFYISRSKSQAPSVVAIKQSASVSHGFPVDGDVSRAAGPVAGANREMYAAVAEALGQDLRDVKDQLDLYIRGDRRQLKRLTDLAPAIQRIGDTLGMVGRGDLRTRLNRRGDELREVERTDVAPLDDSLMGLAGDLLLVESSLDGLGTPTAAFAVEDENAVRQAASSVSSAEMRQHVAVAVGEAAVELAKTKDEILQYLAAPDDPAPLQESAPRLRSVVGVMSILGIDEAADVIRAIAGYVEGLADGGVKLPDAAERDAIADALVGAELYMQGLVEPGQSRERLMYVARSGLDVLGLGETVGTAAAEAAPEPVAATLEEAVAEVAEPALELVETPGLEPELSPAVDDVAATIDLKPVEDVVEPEEPAIPATEPEPVLDSEPEPVLEIESQPVLEVEFEESVLETEPESVLDIEANVANGARLEPPEPSGVDAIDPEILEVFTEEAEEELGVIQRLYPQWRSSPADEEALATIRRSFHTLKGSGRIVGAHAVGEFAWSIENLLNRVIEGTVGLSDDVLSLLDDAVTMLPTLVSECRTSLAGITDIAPIHSRAFALASPGTVSAQAELPSPIDETAATSAVGSIQPESIEFEPLDEESLPDALAESIEIVEPSLPTDTETLVAASVGEPAQPDLVDEPADESILTDSDAQDSEFSELETSSFGVSDSSLFAVFIDEANGHIQALGGFVERCQSQPGACAFDDSVRRAMHTLRGSARTADVTPMAEVAEALEKLGDTLVSLHLPADDRVLGVFARSHRFLLDVAAAGDADGAGRYEWRGLQTDILALRDAVAQGGAVSQVAAGDTAAAVPNPNDAVDPELLEVFLDEAKELLEAMEGELGDWATAAEGDLSAVARLQRTLHTMKGGARMSGVVTVGDLSHAMESAFESVNEGRIAADGDLRDLVRHAADHIAHDIDLLVRGALPDAHTAVIDGLEAAAHGQPWDPATAMVAAAAADESAPVVVGGDSQWLEPADDIESLLLHDETAVATEPNPNDAVDPELLEVFLDEAKELLEAMEGELGDWATAAEGDLSAVARLQRTLHTMKGGARMSGVVTVGDLSHAMESAFESVNEGRIAADGDLRDLVRHAADHIAHDIDLLVRGALPDAHTAVIDGLEAAAHGQPWDPATAMAAPAASAETPVPTVGVDSQLVERGDDSDSLLVDADSVDLGDDSSLLTDSQLLPESELLEDPSYLVGGALPQEPGAVGSVIPENSNVVQFPAQGAAVGGDGFVDRQPKPVQQAAAKGAAERVRVASESLDQMVNHAGEVSIYRARIEQQNSSFAFNLGELGQTIDRLRGQLRDLELETEAQILSRHEREGDLAADFDPLEMDRYSTIQQLSRALSETVEDLSNLGQSLGDLSRDTDTLLLQQARVTTDLQDSLLRTRMVKFASRVPRLERVVRQTAHSVAKDAILKVVGGHEDMDRAILERMMGPLEHLLRNAVSHGIEDANTRLANGKSAQGAVTLAIAREGSDVVITLADDGAGLDKARIRAKAVERGLIPADAQIADDDIYQLILQPGFSTAEQLSQVSGRGVGMDVVLTEVKQLGGTLEIDSQPGHGSSFTIRLPFTLAITDSLLVTLGEDIYAVPHSSMDGVVRITFEDLRAIYDGQLTSYEYAGRKYNVRYLGMMLGTQMPHLNEAQRWYPLLLVRSGEHRVAIQVDSLMGNRQIVVKSVGAQLSTVRWFTGGTILADGQIALILDMNSLIRADSTHQMLDDMAAQVVEPEAGGVSVMVVDDSITVRKVTSRLLERHNMQVITAKDGVDAVSMLQEHRPNVVLLDIEMPRMDGYELARHMRSTPELSRIPIIMITSRSGDKHRKRAFELGVKRYLGKPYQEAELLENIYAVLADAAL